MARESEVRASSKPTGRTVLALEEKRSALVVVLQAAGVRVCPRESPAHCSKANARSQVSSPIPYLRSVRSFPAASNK